MKAAPLILLLLTSWCAAEPKADRVPSPVEVRHQAFAIKAACVKAVTSAPAFKAGACGTSGCMNAYLSCASSGESVVVASAEKAVAAVRSSGSECLSSIESLLAVAGNELPRESELNVEGPLDTSQAVGIVRRLAAYELIYLTIKDESCAWEEKSKKVRAHKP